MRIQNNLAERLEIILRNEDGSSFLRFHLAPAEGEAVFAQFTRVVIREIDPVQLDVVTRTAGLETDEDVDDELTGGIDPTENTDGGENVFPTGLRVDNNTETELRIEGVGDTRLVPQGTRTVDAARLQVERRNGDLTLVIIQQDVQF